MSQLYKARCRLDAVRTSDGKWFGWLYDADMGLEMCTLAEHDPKDSLEALRAYAESFHMQVVELTISPHGSPPAP